VTQRTFTTANLAAAKLINRVLADYPLARERLLPHAVARVATHVGPLAIELRITPQGMVEAVGEGAPDGAAPNVVFRIPLASLSGLVRKDPAAFRQVAFEGDSELAHVLSTVARGVEWDIEEDLSRLLGGGKLADIVSHRAVGTTRSIAEWRDQASQRFAENMAEYLVHEREAFITKDQLEQLARDNEILRDDVARLEARLNLLAK
jgi:ubiquinone biosynthesis protein UbiJ